MDTEATVYVIDDDQSVSRSLERLLRSVNYQVKTFSSGQMFLHVDSYTYPCCIILDVEMPGLNGLELQEALAKRGINIPIIFMTGHATIPMSVKALKAGAVHFLEKPVDQSELLEEIEKAIKLSKKITNNLEEISYLNKHLDSLTPREKEVYDLVIIGKLNKQIAYELGVCEKTVKVHRARVMSKMNVKTLAELIHSSDKLFFESNQMRYE